MDAMAVLRRMAAEGPHLLQADRDQDPADQTELVFGRDVNGDVDAVTWRPLQPVEVSRRALEEIGALSFAPRMPDSGEQRALIYVPGGRLVLNVEKSDEQAVTTSEVSFLPS